MTILWTFEALARAGNGTIRHVEGQIRSSAITGVSIDSRTIAPGDAYFAIKGDVHDGHAFVEAALAKGAALAVVSKTWAVNHPDLGPLMIVDDVLTALEGAGRAARARSPARIAAITGSVGKTSTKETLAAVLAAEGETHAAVGSFNNHWGVPITLARLPQSAKFGVFEIGMNNPHEITPLVAMVRPHVAIITTVEAVHLENFPNVEAIADAKAEIMTGIEPGGAIVLNADNRFLARLAARACEVGISRIVTFGKHEDADVRMVRLSLKPEGSCVQARVFGEDMMFKVGAPGEHLAMNALGVLAVARVMGADLARAAIALAAQGAVKGRGDRHLVTTAQGEITLVDETFNANPVSTKAAIDVLGRSEPGPRGRRIAVLGDMLELGPTGPADHAGLAEALAENKVDLVFCCGPLMKHLWAVLPAGCKGEYAENSIALAPIVATAARGGDVVMVKGSKGSKMGPVVEAVKARGKAAA